MQLLIKFSLPCLMGNSLVIICLGARLYIYIYLSRIGTEFYIRFLMNGSKCAVLPQGGQALIIVGVVCVHIWIECMSLAMLAMRLT